MVWAYALLVRGNESGGIDVTQPGCGVEEIFDDFYFAHSGENIFGKSLSFDFAE
ncbi:MAG: hypothetical protein JXA19_01855 [Anaerolineales bacterium]|nr:hypothetical protein [Anaerolineales bacterium]